MGASKAVAPDYTEGSDAAEFIDGLFGTAMSLVTFHTFITVLRIWYTVTRWQGLVVCEVFKTAFVIHVLYGITKIDDSKFETSGQLVIWWSG